jgi:hypothetical protein
MPANYVLLEKITVGAAGASSVTFSGIPQTGYTDLVVKWSARGDAGSISRSVGLTFNGSTTSYSSQYLQGDGSAASAGTGGSTNIYAGECTAFNATASTFANQELYIPNYASSNNKSVSVDSVSETNATTIYSSLTAGLWSNSSAITSIGLAPQTGNFIQGSTFYLYGVAKLGTTPVVSPYATGGDTIMTDGTYWYHAFRSSGTFTPAKGLSCDILAVAGGGGGGIYRGGGGGSGGVIYFTSKSVSSASTVTIGAGGAAATNGNNSQFASLTVAVAGGGGSNSTGSNGGSGGGGGFDNGTAGTSTQTGTGATLFYGNSGGIITGGGASGGAGGGGSGSVGGNGSATNVGGAGGAGINAYSSWLSATGTGVSGFIAGGGGGAASGAAGSGGGAAGGTASVAPVAAIANTGGGGGGGGDSGNVAIYTGSTGGSGLVIVRYAV